ncbi:MAG: HpcH/HpaI aldolase family protein [Casimicrobiaceae bacterium]
MNRAKQRLMDGKTICGFGITMPCPGLAQILCASEADFLTIDLEHGCLDVAGAHGVIAATAASKCVPIVRVESILSSAVKQVLDAGALGIVFPMVRGGEELERGIAAVLYPPMGRRGIGHHFAPARWGVTGSDYLEHSNDALLKIALIETVEAVERIDEIVAVPGLDVATIAPGDLAASLGYPGQLQHPQVLEAIRVVERAVLKTNVALGGVALSGPDAKRKIEQHYRLLVLGFDVGLLQAASSELVGAIRT